MVEDTSAHAIGKVGGVATYLLINLADMGLSLVLDGRHDEVCWVRVAICRCKSSRLMLIVGAVEFGRCKCFVWLKKVEVATRRRQASSF